MIKRMLNISMLNFKKINFYPCSENPTKETHAFISIYGNDDVQPKINHPLWFDGIQLMFDDVDSGFESKNLNVISDKQADQIVEFLFKIHEHEKEFSLIIHCYAGVSRSAAVGKFANDLFCLKLPNYDRLNLYNTTVYRKLWNAADRRMNPE